MGRHLGGPAEGLSGPAPATWAQAAAGGGGRGRRPRVGGAQKSELLTWGWMGAEAPWGVGGGPSLQRQRPGGWGLQRKPGRRRGWEPCPLAAPLPGGWGPAGPRGCNHPELTSTTHCTALGTRAPECRDLTARPQRPLWGFMSPQPLVCTPLGLPRVHHGQGRPSQGRTGPARPLGALCGSARKAQQPWAQWPRRDLVGGRKPGHTSMCHVETWAALSFRAPERCWDVKT